MDSVSTQLSKKVRDNIKNLILNEQNQVSLQMNNLEQINFDLYTKVCVSIDVAKKLDLIQKAFSLDVPTQIFKIYNVITIKREKRVLKLQFNGHTKKFFSKIVPKNPEQFEKMKINFKSISRFFHNKEDVIIYAKYFPNLKCLTILLNGKNKSSRDFIDNRIEFLENFIFIENVDILINDIKIIKRKDSVQIIQLVSSQKQLKINFQKEIKNEVFQFIDHIIDLTNISNNKLILQLAQEDYSKFDIIQTPCQIKLFGTNTSLKQSIQILEKFPNINSVHIVFSEEDEEEQDFYENLKSFFSTILNLKRIIIIDNKLNNTIQRYNNVMNSCQQKFNNFKLTWDYKQKMISIYNPAHKYLKIKILQETSYQYKLTEDEYIQIFKLHPNTERLLIQSYYEQQLAIQAIPQLNNLKILNFELWSFKNLLDYKPIYHMNLQKIDINIQRYWPDLSFDKINYESLLNHPTCPLISSNTFQFNTQLKYVKIQISKLKHSELFANLILNKYQDTQKIDVTTQNQLQWYYFFAKVLTSPSLLVINLLNQYSFQNNNKTIKMLNQIFKVIQIQKIQIKVIEKQLIGFIPVYLPSLIYDLFC